VQKAKLLSEHLAIETTGLSKSFKENVAVDALDLSVEKGEIFGLVGPDGAGKTTTIRLLTAIMDPSSGKANVAGYNTVHQPEEIKKRIGYMAQRFNLYRDLSVLENLNFYADVFEVTGSERKVRIKKLLQFARLEKFQERRGAHLSGGMQKKLALACTLIHMPELLFLDEPTTGVDPVSRREFWDILTGLHLQGITLFISTPYMDEAERCSRVGLLRQGRMLLCGTPKEIKKMVAGEVIAVWPSDPHLARTLLNDLELVIQVQTFGRQLRLITRHSNEAIVQVKRVLEDNGVEINDIRVVQPRMEEAFVSLVSRAGED
jgi:ABC-2 type transport system ATP-binding protein